MGSHLSQFKILTILVAGSVALVCGAAFSPSFGTPLQAAATTQAAIKIDYPLNDSVFPPEITPPTFLWHDPSPSAMRWVIQVSFGAATQPIRMDAPGRIMQQGEIDANAGPGLALTPEQASTHTWKPDTGVPGHFCTSPNERDWTKRSGRWRRARSIPLNRS